jgi:hypothetical protein
MSNTNYIVTAPLDREKLAPRLLSFTDRTNITVTLLGEDERIVAFSTAGILFTVESGVTFVLGANITLEGRESNIDFSLVRINEGATLIMKDGFRIIGNNTALGSKHAVHINGGIFTMSGGEISGNTSNYGGGVAVIPG